MRSNCIFKEEIKNKTLCTYPKLFGVCFVCFAYLKKTNHIDSKLKYVQYIAIRNSKYFILLISFLSLLVSFLALFINVVKYFKLPK